MRKYNNIYKYISMLYYHNSDVILYKKLQMLCLRDNA